MKLDSKTIQTVLDRFGIHDDASADYVIAHWRQAGDVYAHGGSMPDLEDVVRLETILGVRIGHDAYRRAAAATPDLGRWLDDGTRILRAAAGRIPDDYGVPFNWIRVRLDEWARTAPADDTARYTCAWEPGRPIRTERDIMRHWTEAELAQVVEDAYWDHPGGAAESREFYSRPEHITGDYEEWRDDLLSEGELERADTQEAAPPDAVPAIGEDRPPTCRNL